VDLAYELQDGDGVQRLAVLDVTDALSFLWPRLQELAQAAPEG
jgi:hypothetical protein